MTASATPEQVAAHVEAGEMPELSMSMFATSADYHAAMAGVGEVCKVCTCDELGHTCKWCALKQWKADQAAKQAPKGEAGEMEAAAVLSAEDRSDLSVGACVFRCPPYDKNPQSQRIADLMERLGATPPALQQQPEPVGHVVVDMQSNGPGDRIKWTKLALEHGTPLYASHPAIQQPAFSVIDKVRDLRDVQGQQGLGADSYMRGLYNGLELALCTLEERDPIYAEKDALQHQEVPREPVAWRYRYSPKQDWKLTSQPTTQWAADHSGFEEEPLYASPSTTRQQEAGSDALDARRYRWLTADHDNLEDRQRQRSILHNFDMKSYSAASRDIDAAMLAAAPSTPENAGGVPDGVSACDGWRTSADGLTRSKIAPDAAAPMVPSECVTLRMGADGKLTAPDVPLAECCPRCLRDGIVERESECKTHGIPLPDPQPKAPSGTGGGEHGI